jgi:hypothetical protein
MSLYLKDTSIYSKMTVRIDEKRKERKEVYGKDCKIRYIRLTIGVKN